VTNTEKIKDNGYVFVKLPASAYESIEAKHSADLNGSRICMLQQLYLLLEA